MWRKAIYVLRTEGVGGVLRGYKSYRQFLKTASPDRIRVKLDGRTFLYSFVNDVDFSKPNSFRERPLEKGKPLAINWVIPDLAPGSGGHMTIFRMISFLEKFGHANRIYLFSGGMNPPYRNAKELKHAITKHFLPLRAEVFVGLDDMKESDVLVATSWHTAYPCYSIQNTKRKFYFIQDYEPAFYAVSSEQLFAEQTYRMGYRCVTAGPWLDSLMREKYENQSSFFSLAYDKHIYHRVPEIQRRKKTVCFYGRFVTARRGFELGILALDIVQRKRPDVDIVIFGWDVSNQDIPFSYTHFGLKSPAELARLYNEATIGMVFSMTNVSLIPQEMMACGLPVIEYKGPNTERIFEDQGSIVLAEPDPYHVAEKICFLLDHPKEREQRSERGYRWVQQFHWENSARQVEKAFYSG